VVVVDPALEQAARSRTRILRFFPIPLFFYSFVPNGHSGCRIEPACDDARAAACGILIARDVPFFRTLANDATTSESGSSLPQDQQAMHGLQHSPQAALRKVACADPIYRPAHFEYNSNRTKHKIRRQKQGLKDSMINIVSNGMVFKLENRLPEIRTQGTCRRFQ